MKSARKKVTPKRRGRPATGKDPTVTLRLPVDVTAKIDAWGEKNGLSRSEAIRLFIERGLAKPS